MSDETATSIIVRKLVETIRAGASNVEAFLVISSIDLEISIERRKYREQSRRQLKRLSKAMPSVQSFCDALKTGGLAAARALANEGQHDPRCVWWCDSEAEFEHVLSGIYERLLRSNRPRDAYDFGSCDSLAWVVLWRD